VKKNIYRMEAKLSKLTILLVLIFQFQVIKAQKYYTGSSWGDNGNGTFNNPVLPADYRDPDVIRVDKDYYMITSTFWMSPGITILHSKDLVNWEYSGAAITDISTISRKYTWANMAYDGCVWAPSVSYNPKNKTYYIHWGDNILGFYVVKAKSMLGPWTMPTEVLIGGKALGPQVDDCGVMWDDDGMGYFAYNKYGTDQSYKNYLHKIATDGATLLDKGILIHENNDFYGKNQTGSEAYKLFKRNGYYYLWHNEVPNDGNRKLCLMRSKCIYGKRDDGSNGTFEKPGKYEHGEYFIWGYRKPSQGNIVDSPDGKDWFLVTHLDKAEIEGAPICVVPMKWKNDWIMPITTEDNATGATMDDQRLWINLKKPVQGVESKIPATTDDFSTSKIGFQWLWNHEPRSEKWSLTERPGFLRLYAWQTLRWWSAIDNISLAGNTIYQRLFRNKKNSVTVKIDISNMADGQNAGLLLANYARYGGMGVYQVGNRKYLRYYESLIIGGNSDRNLAINGTEIPQGTNLIYLRNESNFDGTTIFYYSYDGENYLRFGDAYKMNPNGHRGFYIGIFSYNNLQEKGWIDVDEFVYKMDN
jgi:beta-xylosidase